MSIAEQTRDTIPVRDRLLNAVELVVTRDGVSNLSLTAVAKEAGVSKGGLLYHFPTKSALINAIVGRLASQCEASQCLAVEHEPGSPGAFTRAYLTARAEPPDPKDEPIHTALLAAAGTDPQYLDPFRKRSAAWQAKIETDGIDPVDATIVRLAIDGLCLNTLLGMPVPTGEMRREILDKLLSMTRNQS
jgi:AcrR family transcriptional regulator